MEEAKSGELDLGNLDISDIQDHYYADLDKRDLGFKQAIQLHEVATPDTDDFESFYKLWNY